MGYVTMLVSRSVYLYMVPPLRSTSEHFDILSRHVCIYIIYLIYMYIYIIMSIFIYIYGTPPGTYLLPFCTVFTVCKASPGKGFEGRGYHIVLFVL